MEHTTGLDKLELRFKNEGWQDGGDNSEGRGRVEGNDGRRGGGSLEDKVVMLENMKGRDKAFNALIGFSGLRWQHLQQRSSGDVDWEGRTKAQ